jgi:hypothetical protein
MFIALAIVCDEFFVPSLDVIIEKGIKTIDSQRTIDQLHVIYVNLSWHLYKKTPIQ